MSISLKAELETWAAALNAYDNQDFEKSLDLFSYIADSSKILTNMGLIYATIGAHETAVEHFVAAIRLDSFLAIAHFQCGVSNFLIERYDLALLNFEDAYLNLRGNEAINYEQIGLKFKLFTAEILFNKGLAQLNLGYIDQGLSDLLAASRQQVTDEHRVIDEAIRDRGEGYTVFSIPVGILYRPSENKLKNSETKDYLGKAKLVAASDSDDAFTEFTGVKKLKQASGKDRGDNDDENKSNAGLPTLIRSATVPAPRAEPIAIRALERSKTTPQPGSETVTTRRTKSASNPENVPKPPFAPISDLSRSNTSLGRSHSARLGGSSTATPGVLPLRTKTPQGATGRFAGASAGGTRAGEEAEAALQSSPQPSSLSLPIQPGQHTNQIQAAPLVLPAGPAPAKGGHLTQFYEAYMDVYTNDSVLRSAVLSPPTSRTQSNASSSQTHSPVAPSFYQLSQPQEQQLIHSRMQSQSTSSLVRTSSSASTSANIRVKLHYQDDVRGMMIPPTISFNGFVERVTTKFGTSLMGLGMKFMDEEGTTISLRDESDFELAMETARGRSEGKIEVWCVDV